MREPEKSQKVSDSHRNDVSPLTQGLRYRAACDVSVMVTSSCRVVRGGGCLRGRQSSRRCRCRRQTAVYRRADSVREYELDHKTTNRRRERRTAVQDSPRHSPTNKHQQPHHVAVCTENQSVNQSISVLRRFMYKLLLRGLLAYERLIQF